MINFIVHASSRLLSGNAEEPKVFFEISTVKKKDDKRIDSLNDTK